MRAHCENATRRSERHPVTAARALLDLPGKNVGEEGQTWMLYMQALQNCPWQCSNCSNSASLFNDNEPTWSNRSRLCRTSVATLAGDKMLHCALCMCHIISSAPEVGFQHDFRSLPHIFMTLCSTKGSRGYGVSFSQTIKERLRRQRT